MKRMTLKEMRERIKEAKAELQDAEFELEMAIDDFVSTAKDLNADFLNSEVSEIGYARDHLIDAKKYHAKLQKQFKTMKEKSR